MKAYALQDATTPARIVTLPEPTVGPDDVLVAIRAASVNGFDVYQASGYLAAMMPHQYPTVVGRDFAGVVEAVGSGVTDFAAGDEVFGFVPSMPPLEHGSFASHISAADLVLARRPANLDVNAAAALPLAGSAALDLLDAAGVQAGDTLLIVGATGGVGSLLIQLAALHGVTVIATARPDEEGFVRDLGASETIDYAAGSVADAVRQRYPDGITALVDLVNRRDALTELGSVVKAGGRIASLLSAVDVEHFAARDIVAANVMANPTPEKLQQLASLAEAGDLRVIVQDVFDIDQAGEALAAFQKGSRGKLVLAIGGAAAA